MTPTACYIFIPVGAGRLRIGWIESEIRWYLTQSHWTFARKPRIIPWVRSSDAGFTYYPVYHVQSRTAGAFLCGPVVCTFRGRPGNFVGARNNIDIARVDYNLHACVTSPTDPQLCNYCETFFSLTSKTRIRRWAHIPIIRLELTLERGYIFFPFW